MNDDEFKEMTEKVAEDRSHALGRPKKAGSGTMLMTCSVPYGFKALCDKYEISPSFALQEGILMILNTRFDFPQTEYEEKLVKGIYIEKQKTFAEIIAKVQQKTL